MKKIKNKKNIIIVSTIAIILLVAGGIYYLQNKNNSAKPTETSEGQEPINFDPPTDEDKTRAEQNKQDIVQREENINKQPDNQTNGKKTVKPVITYAGQYGSKVEVGGYIPGIFEEGGVCKASFTKGSSTFSKQVNAVTNASSVDCPKISAGNSEFPSKGTWTVKLSYSSPKASGTSDSRTVEVK